MLIVEADCCEKDHLEAMIYAGGRPDDLGPLWSLGMANKMYQKNPGRDEDWIAEGELDETHLQKLGSNNKILEIEFRSVTGFPERPFRHLASIRRLKRLQFHSCPITAADLADLASLTDLESLWFDGCPVRDESISELARLPKLTRVVLNNTQITDAALMHLARIPRLEWLWLDGTAVTDRGLAHLTTATGLNSLAIRDTAVTDDGILELAVLAKLNLSAGPVRGSAVTEAGLDAFFRAQQAAIKATKALQKAAQKSTAIATPAEIDVAKDVLYSFFKAMNEWRTSCFERWEAAKKLSATAQVGDEVWEECREKCREIFRRYCTPKTRVYGGPENFSIGGSPDYSADPDQEPITNIDSPSRQRIVIETQQKFVVQYRCQYVLLKKHGKWLIDSKKIWRAGWEQTTL
jgi:NTF2 fold immunity protein